MPTIEVSEEMPERARAISNYIERIISGAKLDPEAKAELAEIFETANEVEKVSHLFDLLLDYIWTKKAIREEKTQNYENAGNQAEESLDPAFIAELKYLWNLPETRKIFLRKYQADHKEKREYGASDLGRKWKSLNTEIEQKEKDYAELEQALFLKKITRPDKLSAAKTKLSLRAKQLIGLRRERKDLSGLKVDGEKLPATPENTDVLAQADFEKIQKYNRELNSKDKFVWLPHFKENLLPKILNALQNTKKFPLLIGEPGSGKTNLVKAVAQLLTGNNALEEGCDPSTNKRDLIQDRDLKRGDTFRSYGVVTQAFTGYKDSEQKEPECNKGRVVFLEELLKADLDKIFAIVKMLAQKRVGDDFNSEIKREVLPGSAMIAATNPPGTRHDLPQIPPAFEREFTMIEVGYPPMTANDPQLYDFMRAALMNEKGVIAAAKCELAPAFTEVEIANGEKLPDGPQISGEEKLLADPTDPKHGYLYRLSFALKALQDSYVSHGKLDIAKNLLRYEISADGQAQITPTGGEQLTLSKAIITLKDIAGFMQGFKDRKEKADENFQTESLAEFMRFKLEKFLAESNQEDQLKLRALFNYFHLLDDLSTDQKSEIKNSEPLTAKEIGYLSPTVPRPLKFKDLQDDSGAGETEAGKPKPPEEIRPLETTQVMLENGKMINIKDHSFEFSKAGKTIAVRKNVSFEIGAEKFYFAGIVADQSSEYDGQLVARLASEKADEQLFRILSRAEIEAAEFPEMSIEIAREIMERGGKEFFLGPKDVEATFGCKLRPEDIDPIPFSREEIEFQQQKGLRLEYFLDETSDGTPFNLENMAKKAIAVLGSNVIENDANGKPSKYLLYNNQFEDNGDLKLTIWLRNEAGVLSEKPRRGWRFSSAEILPETKNKGALSQIEELINNAKTNFFAGVFPAEYLEAEEEFREQKEKIEEFIKTNEYAKASSAISQLKISELLGERLTEIMFRYLVSFKKGKQFFTDGNYARAMLGASFNGSFYFGDASAFGAYVCSYSPEYAFAGLGAWFSRHK